MSSISSHRRARKGPASSTDSKFSHQSHGRNASCTRARSSVVRREGPRYPPTERSSSPHPQSPVSDQQSEQEESFASNKASFGSSSHDSSFTSKNGSNELETQSYETSSQYSYSHLGYFSHDCMMISQYDSELTIEEEPNEEYYSYQAVAQHATRGLATVNGIQAPSIEYHSLQTYSPAIEMWTRQKSRDERIRLGLSGHQQAPSAFFECDQENVPEADNPN